MYITYEGYWMLLIKERFFVGFLLRTHDIMDLHWMDGGDDDAARFNFPGANNYAHEDADVHHHHYPPMAAQPLHPNADIARMRRQIIELQHKQVQQSTLISLLQQVQELQEAAKSSSANQNGHNAGV